MIVVHSRPCHFPPDGPRARVTGVARSLLVQSLAGENKDFRNSFFNCVLPLPSQEKGFAGFPEGRLSEWAMKVKWKRGFVVCWRWVVLLARTCVNREITASYEAMALACRALGSSPSVCSLGPRQSVGPQLLPLRGKGTGSSPASQLSSGPVLLERPRAPFMSFHNSLLLLRRWNICLPPFYLAHLPTEVSLSLK